MLLLGACGGGDEIVADRSAEPDVASPTGLLDEPTTPVPATAPSNEPTTGASRTAPTLDPASPVDDSTDTAAQPTPPPATVTPVAATALPPGAIELLVPSVLDTYPHDITAYTQGLEVTADGLLESTGRQGHPGSSTIFASDLRLVDVTSGEIITSVDVPGDVFAEGLTLVGDELVQLTWQDGKAFFYDANTFELRREITYEGQGWGLCFDGQRLVMTDGSSTLFFRDPATFEIVDTITVTQSGRELPQLNELECVDGRVWANVYRTDFVVRIDPATGAVDGIVDASALEQPRVSPTEVLNGIAFDAATNTWLMTGKFWPTMYRVEFTPVGVAE